MEWTQVAVDEGARVITCMGPLSGETVWAGDVLLTGDVFVPAGAKLRLEPGARVRFAARPHWSCSVFWRSPTGDSVEASIRDRCDIVVAGLLEIAGTSEAPVHVGTDSMEWGGITCFERARVRLSSATLERSPLCSVRLFDEALLEAEDSRCEGATFGLWAWGTSRISWTRGQIHAGRASVICCEGSSAHLVDVDDESSEGVAAMDSTLIRVERSRFKCPRKHCVVARQKSWVKLRGCRTPAGERMDIVRLDDAHVAVSA